MSTVEQVKATKSSKKKNVVDGFENLDTSGDNSKIEIIYTQSMDASKPKIMMLMPIYTTIEPQTFLSLFAIAKSYPNMTIATTIGESYIIRARNSLAQTFLESDYDWSLWVDSDMVYPLGNDKIYNDLIKGDLDEEFSGMHTINRLLSHNLPMVGGHYLFRNGSTACTADGMKDRPRVFPPEDAVVPQDWVGTGCLLVHKDVYVGIQKKFPHLSPNDNTRGHWRFFASDANNPETGNLGEDQVFGWRARQAGFQPHIDIGLRLGHLSSRKPLY